MSNLSARLMSRFGSEAGTRERRRASRGVTSARIMAPRIVFGVTSLALTLFGMLMIYSASSITGLTSEMYHNDPAYFLFRQSVSAFLGVVGAIGLARLDYHVWRDKLLKRAWIAVVLLLVFVFTPLAGRDAYGASRWIGAFGFTIQPSEFAKIVLVLVGANLVERYFAEGSMDGYTFIKLTALGVGLPLILILAQPDKGTVGVVLITLLVMSYLSGVSGTIIMGLIVGVVAIVLFYAFIKDEYSRARILTLFNNPFSDEFGSGYQLTRGFFAFGTGGLKGLGLGMSRQKYNYLPMAHTDFIFAIIGEELGFFGAAGLVVAFGVLLWSGLKIAEQAPDLFGRLIAAGYTSLFIIQLLLNLTGVMGMVPLSGKPVPFISYGGSSIFSTLLMVGLVMSVSMRSSLPETSHDRRRAQIHLADSGNYVTEPPATLEGSTAGQARTRSFRVHDGGMSSTDERSRRHERTSAAALMRPTTLAGRVTVDAQGRKRVDLGPSPSERLRGARNERDRS